MAQERQERVQVVRGEGYTQRREIVETAPTTRQILVSRIVQFVWLIAAIIVAALAVRFMLVLIGSDANSGFGALIFSITNPFVTPFIGIVNSPDIDIAAIIAIFVVMFVTWVLVTLFRLLFADTRRTRRVTTVNLEE